MAGTAMLDTGGGGASALEEYIRQEMAKSKEPKTREETFTNVFSWEHAAVNKIYSDIKHVANVFDLDLDYVNGWFKGQENDMLTWIQMQIDRVNSRQPATRLVPGLQDPTNLIDQPIGVPRINLDRPEGIEEVFDLARQWVSMYFPGFRDAVLIQPQKPGRPGARRPSAAEIRAQFDIEQLTRVANEMSKALLLEDSSNARTMASAYIESFVKNPEQKLDYDTFIRNQLLETSRAKAIYKHKPEGLTEEQFLQPYVAAFQQMAGPGFGDQMAETASAGARLGAAPAAFQQRMMRTSQVQTSTPFLSKMGQRLTNVKGVLR